MTQTNEHNQRDLSGPPVLSEPQPLGELILTVLRYLPAIIPFAILVAAGAYQLTTPTQPKAVATSEIGLTREVVWPFFDAARLRTVTIAEDPEFRLQLDDAVDGIAIDEFWIDMPENQAYVALNATSDSRFDLSGQYIALGQCDRRALFARCLLGMATMRLRHEIGRHSV